MSSVRVVSVCVYIRDKIDRRSRRLSFPPLSLSTSPPPNLSTLIPPHPKPLSGILDKLADKCGFVKGATYHNVSMGQGQVSRGSTCVQD